jgi:hypothetical protein
MKIQWGMIQKSGFLISILVTGVIVKIIVRPDPHRPLYRPTFLRRGFLLRCIVELGGLPHLRILATLDDALPPFAHVTRNLGKGGGKKAKGAPVRFF